MKPVVKSLAQLLGEEYMDAVKRAAVSLMGLASREAERLAGEEVEFFGEQFAARIENLLHNVGKALVPPFENSEKGASTRSFNQASNTEASPLSGVGYLRLGEDGHLYLASKSEHYHTPLGHSFPGYRLIEYATKLGIPNATHNNTRGYITRRLERELVREVNGIARENSAGLEEVLGSEEPQVLNRVINLETGSLAVEAGVKMMLARFYRLQESSAEPKYSGRIPVFLVLGDDQGGSKANYHGTTVITQMMRDMWPGLYARMEREKLLKVCQVDINNFEDFEKKFRTHNRGDYKVAGFLHELVLMNYGGIRLRKEFVQKAHDLCHEHDAPVLVDEIQSCLWHPDLFLFKEYGVSPDFVTVGKGFPGGLYPASRIITTAEMDNLNQFGALVTNGQEELASLAYLITMEFARANREHTQEIGRYIEDSLHCLREEYPGSIEAVEGHAHLAAVHFYDADLVEEFVSRLKSRCIDISAQAYKAVCPPAALMKLPIIASKKVVDFVVDSMREELKDI